VNVLGVDPGTAYCGLAIVSVEGTTRTLLHLETISQDARTTTEDRHRAIALRIASLIDEFQVGLIAIEEQASVIHGSEAKGRNNYRSRKVADIVPRVLGIADVKGIPTIVIRAQTVRSLMGVPRVASKEELERATRRMCPGERWRQRSSQHSRDAAAVATAGERKWSVDSRRSRAADPQQTPMKKAFRVQAKTRKATLQQLKLPKGL